MWISWHSSGTMPVPLSAISWMLCCCLHMTSHPSKVKNSLSNPIFLAFVHTLDQRQAFLLLICGYTTEVEWHPTLHTASLQHHYHNLLQIPLTLFCFYSCHIQFLPWCNSLLLALLSDSLFSSASINLSFSFTISIIFFCEIPRAHNIYQLHFC
jgi:hypothetical protein